MKNIRTTPEYRRLMGILGTAGVQEKESRLRLATKILGREVSSYTTLTPQEISKLLSHFAAWEEIQKERMITGSLQDESVMISEMLVNSSMLELSRDSLLSSAASRRKFMSTKKNTEAFDFDAFRNEVNKLASNVGVKESKIETYIGRWPEDKIIPAPSLSIALGLGIGGIARGKIYHFWGKQHAGKTMLAYHLAAAAQSVNVPVIYVDTESAVVGEFAQGVGVDMDKIVLYQPENLEQMCSLLIRLSESGALIIVDSVPALSSAADLERDLQKKPDGRVGGNAKLWTQTLGNIRKKLSESETTLVLINQVRANLDAGMYQDKDKPYGSAGIQHNVDVSVKVTAVSEKNATLKDRNYRASSLRWDKNRFAGDAVPVKIPFKPGYPYNRNVDMLRTISNEITPGSKETWVDLCENAIMFDHVVDDISGDIISKKNRWVIKIDPLMMRAILIDDPDFDEVDIEPVSEEEYEKLAYEYESPIEYVTDEDGNFITDEKGKKVEKGNQQFFSVPDVDSSNFEYFNIPGLGEVKASSWFAKHPEAREILIERITNGLNRKHLYVTE